MVQLKTAFTELKVKRYGHLVHIDKYGERRQHSEPSSFLTDAHKSGKAVQKQSHNHF